MQQLDRFQEAHRYRGKTPLKELWFEVHVWRSPVIEEDTRELICHRLTQYGSKLLSPQERLLELQQWVRTSAENARGGSPAAAAPPQQQQWSAAEDGGVEMTEMPQGVGASSTAASLTYHRLVRKILEAPTLSDLGMGAQQQNNLPAEISENSSTLQQQQQQPPPSAGSAPGSPLTTNSHAANGANLMCSRLQSYFQTQQQLCLFSRPPCEDYIDEEELVSPIEPRQAASPLARITLTQHRVQHRDNPNLYLLWSLGEVHLSSEAYRTTKGHVALTHSSLSNAQGGPLGEGELRGLLSAQWKGDDVVMCTITSQSNSETTFLAKPSLGVEHTLLVTTKYIYTFKVMVVENGAQQQHQLLGSTAAAGGFGSITQLPEDLMPQLAASTSGGGGTEASSPTAAGDRQLSSTLGNLQQPPMTTSASGLVSTGTAGLSESERRALLRQVMAQGAAATREQLGKGAPSAVHHHSTSATTATFTPLPPLRSAFGPMRRLHVFGTLETITGVHRSSVFVRAQWVLPNPKLTGVELDHSVAVGGTEDDQPLTLLSQMTFGAHMLNREYQYDTVHHVNLPFELHLLVPQRIRESIQLALTVYTAGSGAADPHVVEGYGCLTVAQLPGMVKDSVLLWKPRQTGWEYLKSVFLGGGPSLTSLDEVGIPAWVTEAHSKAGLIAESSGAVHVQYATVWQEGTPVEAAPVAAAAAIGGPLSSGKASAVPSSSGGAISVVEGPVNRRGGAATTTTRGGNGGLNPQFLMPQ